MKYMVGYPGWKFMARIGVTVHLRVEISYDPDAKVYWAKSPDLDGLITEAKTIDDLKRETLECASILLRDAIDKDGAATAAADFSFHDNLTLTA